VIWLGEGPVPELRRVRRGRDTFGTSAAGNRPWAGLIANRDYVVTGVSQVPLLPAAGVLVLALAALALAWRREGM
jgi:LPXTG-motif cell wall-anchored protein